MFDEKLIKDLVLKLINAAEGVVELLDYYELNEEELSIFINNKIVREALIRDFIYTRKNIR